MLRDTTLGPQHVTTCFFDGQGFMVRANSGVTRAAEMRGATICLVHGTTNEQVTADRFRSVNTPFLPVLFERTDQATAALHAKRCDGFGIDAPLLAGTRPTLPDPKAWNVLPERFSKEPCTAATSGCPARAMPDRDGHSSAGEAKAANPIDLAARARLEAFSRRREGTARRARPAA